MSDVYKIEHHTPCDNAMELRFIAKTHADIPGIERFFDKLVAAGWMAEDRNTALRACRQTTRWDATGVTLTAELRAGEG